MVDREEINKIRTLATLSLQNLKVIRITCIKKTLLKLTYYDK